MLPGFEAFTVAYWRLNATANKHVLPTPDLHAKILWFKQSTIGSSVRRRATKDPCDPQFCTLMNQRLGLA